MSTERPNIAGIVVLTVCITAALLTSGWYVVSYVMPQQTVSAPEEAPAAPAPKRKARRTKDGGGAQASSAASTANEPPATSDDGAEADVTTAAAPDAIIASAAAISDAPIAHTEPEAAPASAAVLAPAMAHEDARSIMQESQRRTDAKFYRYDGLLQSFDAKDRITEKRWVFDRQGSHGRSKSVLRFTAPAEVKGVALLIHNHPDRVSDQWMWTPALERDRRVALQDRSTRFFGTDFSFEDLEEQDVEQFDYSMLGSEPSGGVECWKIQLTPKASRSSQYTREVAWVRKDNYAFARLDSYVKDDVVRRLNYSNVENVQGIWTARVLEMADLRRGTRTRLTLQEVRYNAPVKDDQFTLQAISH
jgi:outer membrane lipoprotein-sorting protein